MRILTLATGGLLGACACTLAGAAPEPPKLAFPVACVIGQTCEVQNYPDRDPGPGVLDYRCGRRTYEAHSGLDIRLLDTPAMQRGVNVLAAAPGRVARQRDGVMDISRRSVAAASVAGQECGNGVVIDHGGGWETQYCHMARGSIVVKPGASVTAGQPIGRIGMSGNTEYPHLHLTVRQNGKMVDPFAPSPVAAGACRPQAGMWTAAAAQKLTYKAGAILNAGFAGAAVTMDGIERGDFVRTGPAAPYLVTYLRGIALEKGDELELVLKAPSGAVLAQNRTAGLDRDKAEYFHMIGKKRPAEGWPAGAYTADLRVHRGGRTVVERRLTHRF